MDTLSSSEIVTYMKTDIRAASYRYWIVSLEHHSHLKRNPLQPALPSLGQSRRRSGPTLAVRSASPLAQRLVEEHLGTLVLLPEAGYLRDILALSRPLQLLFYFDQARLKAGYRLFQVRSGVGFRRDGRRPRGLLGGAPPGPGRRARRPPACYRPTPRMRQRNSFTAPSSMTHIWRASMEISLRSWETNRMAPSNERSTLSRASLLGMSR